MNSRDRLRHGELRSKIEVELEELLKKHPGLRKLKEQRRRKEIEDTIGDAKPLLETIEKIIKKSPTLSKLFVEGMKLSNPHDKRGVEEQEVFEGKVYPTSFKLKKDYPKEKPKNCPINQRFRVQFETDAENEYFKRVSNPGEFYIWANEEEIDDFSLNLWNGIANLTIKLPDKVEVGDIIHFGCEVEDIGRTEPFYNEFYIKVESPQEVTKGGQARERAKPHSREKGEGRERTSNLNLPNIKEVRENDWEEFGFNKESALSVKFGGEGEGYDFYVNIDNIHLQTEIKGRSKLGPKLLETQYTYGMVLIGLALLNEFENINGTGAESEDDGKTIYENISETARAISPFLLPMISSLGELEVET